MDNTTNLIAVQINKHETENSKIPILIGRLEIPNSHVAITDMGAIVHGEIVKIKSRGALPNNQYKCCIRRKWPIIRPACVTSCSHLTLSLSGASL